MPRKKIDKDKLKKSLCRQPLSAYLFWPIFVILFVFFILALSNLFSLWHLRSSLQDNLFSVGKELVDGSLSQSLSESEQEIEAEIEENLPVDSVKLVPLESTENPLDINLEQPGDSENNDLFSQALLTGTAASFGDTFSGLAYINSQESDLFWDENTTAFTLPPLYNLSKKNNCASPDCGLSKSSIDITSSCLASGCLSKDEKDNLYFKGKALLLPPALRGETIKNVTIFVLESEWLIGFVTGPMEKEQGWVYRFDGLSFSPLVNNETEHKILPRYQRGGGKIYFGGTGDDFLILYAGYDGIAFRVQKNKIEDISRFFGLRVMSGGFSAQIFRLGIGQTANYYICGLNQNNPLLLKIWSNSDASSGGALDFSSLIFKGAFRTEGILCGLGSSQEKELMIAAKKSGSYELWSFKDMGFDISKTRQVTSLNFYRKDKELIAAIIADMYLDIDSSKNNKSQFYLANNNNSFEPVEPYIWHSFKNSGEDLYWRLEIKPGKDKYYSPWFYHLNRLDYLSS